MKFRALIAIGALVLGGAACGVFVSTEGYVGAPLDAPVEGGVIASHDGAVDDASSGDDAANATDAPTTTSESCAAGQSCTLTCDQGGCTISAGANAQVTLSCKAGGCNVTAAKGAAVTIDCAGGNCSSSCAGESAQCTIVHCEGGNCRLDCTSPRTTCALHGCTQNCATTCANNATCVNDCQDTAAGCTSN